MAFTQCSATPREQTGPGVWRQVLAHDAELMLVRVWFRRGAVGEVHSHPHRQASFVAAGSFEVRVETERRVLGAGDSFFIPPGVPHGVVALADGELVDAFTPARADFLAKPGNDSVSR